MHVLSTRHARRHGSAPLVKWHSQARWKPQPCTPWHRRVILQRAPCQTRARVTRCVLCPSKLSQSGLVRKRGVNLKKCLSRSEYSWAEALPALRFGQFRRDNKHLEVTWETAMPQPWGLFLSRKWGWGVKKACQRKIYSSLVRRGTHWKGLIDETPGRQIQNKGCRHSSHCRLFLNDCCAYVCVCRWLSRKRLLSLLAHIPSPWVNFLGQKSAQK